MVGPDLIAGFVHLYNNDLALIVIPWKDMPRGRYTFEETRPYSVTFRLPPIARHWKYEEYTMHSRSRICWNPPPGFQAHLERTFTPSDSQHSLVSLEFEIKPRFTESSRRRVPYIHSRYQVIVPCGALKAHVDSCVAREASRIVPWSDWSADTRVLGGTLRCVYGNRLFAFLQREQNEGSDEIAMHAYQFDSVDSMLRDTNENIVAWPSILRRHSTHPFQEHALAKAALPYRLFKYNTSFRTGHWRMCIIAVGDNFLLVRQQMTEDSPLGEEDEYW